MSEPLTYDIRAEADLLGSLMLAPELLDRVSERVGPGDFYDGRHRSIYETMLALHQEGRRGTVDVVVPAMRARPGRNGKSALGDLGIDEASGRDFILGIIDDVPVTTESLTEGDVDEYTRQVVEAARQRRLLSATESAQKLLAGRLPDPAAAKAVLSDALEGAAEPTPVAAALYCLTRRWSSSSCDRGDDFFSLQYSQYFPLTPSTSGELARKT